MVESKDDERLEFLFELAEMFRKMGKPLGGRRRRCLTIDTSNALWHAINGLVELCNHLLDDDHDFVMFGYYSNDPLERPFRSRSG